VKRGERLGETGSLEDLRYGPLALLEGLQDPEAALVREDLEEAPDRGWVKAMITATSRVCVLLMEGVRTCGFLRVSRPADHGDVKRSR
jgi:hypothetical protein